MQIITVVQARFSSTRLPGKVLLPILEKPILIRMIERVRKAKFVGQLVIATSINSEDDQIEKLCNEYNFECYRGSLTDLLDRHYQVGLKYNADAVVKIPSDCPLIDPSIIDKVIKNFTENNFDYVSNLHPATYPDGNDVEIFSFNALEKAWKEATKNFEREHTTPYFWENQNLFKLGNVKWETGLDLSTSLRFTLDYFEDYQFIKNIYEELYPKNPDFSLQDILILLKEKPELLEINKKYAGTYWYDNHLDELKNIEEYKSKKL
ncbi:MAG: glycosyltransferase family protein [Stygiobacter sp.]|jgi:spore coat polysaccharide biosynthesis protein SpsF|uniref:Glycosyltransferase family protein n=1 Tax=Stygiobacter electus TaxID=3032292 RepID=A0AAE3NXD6_9BACT|nr:glycosyltransferase family protein [Stygiobacter electus]MDF1612716.1 glycosyltransferase family protein [Stygiobacter electus]